MHKYFKIIGVCIAVSSFISFIDPAVCFFTVPIIFSLGSIVYGIGVLMERK